MIRHQRNAGMLLSCGIAFTFLAVMLAATTTWPGVFIACYIALLSFWCSRAQARKGRRLEEEAEWWRRTRLGVRQPPLSPCCMRFDETGILHDQARCTAGRIPELWFEPSCVDVRWQELIADLGDLNQEEEA